MMAGWLMTVDRERVALASLLALAGVTVMSRALVREAVPPRSLLALGIEALERFLRGEPLHRVHECVFGVLALESGPVDPRL